MDILGNSARSEENPVVFWFVNDVQSSQKGEESRGRTTSVSPTTAARDDQAYPTDGAADPVAPHESGGELSEDGRASAGSDSTPSEVSATE